MIGLPVWSAIRPAARAIAVCTGKGATDAVARLSAVMEAVETSCAEEAERLAAARGSIARMTSDGRDLLPPEALAKCRGRLDPDRERVWVAGREMGTGRTLLAPYEAIGVDDRADAPWDRAAFAISSAGTAAHPDPEAALRAALLEAIEHDALAQALAWPTIWAGLPRVAPRGRCAALAARAAEAGVEPVLLDATTELGVPTAICLLHDAPDASGRVRRKPFRGSASRPDWDAAAEAALLEAVQSRLTDIAGARDDIAAEDFDRTAPAAIPERPRAAPPPDHPARDPAALARALARAGIGAPVVFDLAPDPAVACVAVVVPGLGIHGGRPAARTRRRVLRSVLAGR